MKCPPRYKNLGLETFGNKKKVTDEMLKQLCKNDEYLYQQIRILLDLTDPESRKRFYPPYYDDNSKSFGYKTGIVKKDNKEVPCYMMHPGGSHKYIVDFTTSNDGSYMSNGIVYDNNETVIDHDRTQGDIDIYVDDEGFGHAVIMASERNTKKTVPKTQYITKKTYTKTDIAKGKAKKDSWCYGPYGAMKPNGWWYVGYDKNKNYHVKSAWKKKPYTPGMPSKCRAQTFTARNTGWVTKVNLNLKTESKKRAASPFSCEIWACDKKGKPTGKPLGRVERSFVNTGGRIESFIFKKKIKVEKKKKYAVVMRSPLSHRDTTYMTAGWPRTCYTNYMKNTYYYGAAWQSTNNGKTWLKYSKKNYGALHANKNTMPIAFGFEVFIQPTKTKTVLAGTKQIPIEVPVDEGGTEKYYEKGNHYLFFKIPSSEPIHNLTITAEGDTPDNTNISFDISYNGKDYDKYGYVLSPNHFDGEGSYNLSDDKPTFVIVRCNLYTNDEKVTPRLNMVEFQVDTSPARKAYIRSYPYHPETAQMLPACIWSEVNVNYDVDVDELGVDAVNVEVDIVREVEAQQRILFKKDTVAELGALYCEYKGIDDLTIHDDGFRRLIQNDPDFINYLKSLEPPVYVLSSFPKGHEKYYKYFEHIDLPDYPAHPLISCKELLDDYKISLKDIQDNGVYDLTPANPTVTLTTNNDLPKRMLNVVFQQAEVNDNLEGVIEKVMEYDTDYTVSGNEITFKLNGENFSKCIVKEANGKIKNFVFENNQSDNEIDLTINLEDSAYVEHMNYKVDYSNKTLKMKDEMLEDVTGGLLITYNPLWIRGLTKNNFPLRMDMWTETFELHSGKNDLVTRVAPRDNLREVVINDDEETLKRIVLDEDVDFEVDYINNIIHLFGDYEGGEVVTVRYTPNLTDTALSIAYRLDREDDASQGYVFGNYFTTRT